MNSSFQRARSPEHKELRRRMILDAAARVLDRDGFNDTSLNAIAQEAGVVKSGLYRYFESREEILLELMVSDVQELTAAFRESIRGPMDLDDVAALIAGSFIDRPRLCLLTSRMASTLEHNITGETIRMLKRRLNACSADMAEDICRAIPHWQMDDCLQGLRMTYMLVAGLYPMSCPPAHVQAVLDEPEFCSGPPEFVVTVGHGAQVICRGLDTLARERPDASI